ncbi:MAG: ABC transporter ATP-binding protein [Bacteroidia bacterium]
MKSLWHLNKYFFKYRKRLLWGVFFVVISNFFGVFPAQVVRHAFDLVGQNILLYRLSDNTGIQSHLLEQLGQILLLFAALVIALALSRGLFMFFMRQTIIVMSRKIEYDLKNEIYHHYQRLSLSFYRRNNTGDLIARITEDVSRVRMYLGPAIMYTINLVTLIVLVVAIMLSVNVKLTLYTLLPLPVLALSIYFVNNIIHKRSTAIQEQLSRLTTFVQEVFSGIRVIKSFSSEQSVKDHFGEEVNVYREKSMAMVRVDALFFPLILLLIGVSTLITLYVGGQLVMQGLITPGNIAEFFIYVNLLTWPVASIGWVTSLVQRAAASQARINQLLETPSDIVPEEGKVLQVNGNIEFRNVSFVYPDTGIQALKDISFLVNSGEMLGIIGRTGSGKSTIAYLMMRLYDPQQGSVLIEGEDISSLRPDLYRQQIGYVPQDDFLFSDSIANNIFFGYHQHLQATEELTEQERESLLREAAETADVLKDIHDFPEGFETGLGERGITLSGGQKQRVAIARAIIGNPKVLIFDDSFSAIDTHTEAEILKNMGKVMKGKTTVLISHRVSTVKNADNILVLDEGRIVERGAHSDLISSNGYYAELYKKQLLEKELYEKETE